MPRLMRVLAPLLAIALGGCSLLGGLAGAATDTAAAAGGAVADPTTTAVTTAAQVAQSGAQQAQAKLDQAAAQLQPTGATPTLPATPAQNDKRFVYADVYVDMTNPTGQRALAAYFSKPEVWTIEKFEMLTDTLRHFRFRKLAGQNGQPLPDVDPLLQNQ